MMSAAALGFYEAATSAESVIPLILKPPETAFVLRKKWRVAMKYVRKIE